MLTAIPEKVEKNEVRQAESIEMSRQTMQSLAHPRERAMQVQEKLEETQEQLRQLQGDEKETQDQLKHLEAEQKETREQILGIKAVLEHQSPQPSHAEVVRIPLTTNF
ncbi:hypothetical protein PFICI_01607 [Pestalotiopsis fici W106-1]|uniref:Uncharacterized protein n=1 Tax=Pestalotiopsis fici (strain W106-1 / CGMCC3.15140) TaxID=1229662 RepID=W3XP81_PESFW|nr:uncharacterized protein PFICI_01607 [Pestalotiopsis fici W106-1]ETS87779.1 hypothetical protein PFICI_01607 [Pestalotiopsis fici W106-1]